MSVSGIGASSCLTDYWELLRRSGTKQNAQTAASALDAIAPVGEAIENTPQATEETTTAATAPDRQNLFAEQLAATILEQEQEEEAAESAPTTAAQPLAAAIGGAGGASSDGPSNKITVKIITDGGVRYIVGVRTDENGEEIEVFRIPQNASAKKLPLDDPDEFSEMKVPGNSEEDAAKTARSAVLTREAHIAYRMSTPSTSTYNAAA